MNSIEKYVTNDVSLMFCRALMILCLRPHKKYYLGGLMKVNTRSVGAWTKCVWSKGHPHTIGHCRLRSFTVEGQNPTIIRRTFVTLTLQKRLSVILIHSKMFKIFLHRSFRFYFTYVTAQILMKWTITYDNPKHELIALKATLFFVKDSC